MWRAAGGWLQYLMLFPWKFCVGCCEHTEALTYKPIKKKNICIEYRFLAPVHVLNHQLAHTLRSTKVEFRRPEL